MIRNFEQEDIPRAREIHADNKLPENCFPNLTITTPTGKEEPNRLFIVNRVFEHEGRPAMMSFLKITSELYLILDHTVGTPEERLEWLKELKEDMKHEAWKHGLEQMTAFVPLDIEESFAKRLEELGFVKSAYSPWTLNLE